MYTEPREQWNPTNYKNSRVDKMYTEPREQWNPTNYINTPQHLTGHFLSTSNPKTIQRVFVPSSCSLLSFGGAVHFSLFVTTVPRILF